MPEVEIHIGGRRSFDVACQEGEEHYLQSAAQMLDGEASTLTEQIGRLPEARMLLMAGLMLADKTAGVEDKLREMQAQVCGPGGRAVSGCAIRPRPIPTGSRCRWCQTALTDSLAELAARAESLAAEVEEKAG